MADPTGAAAPCLARLQPAQGLAVARMAAHITYLSDEALHRKFGRQLQDRTKLTFGFDADFQVESYSATRARPSSTASTPTPTYMTRAMDYFDLAQDYGGARQRLPRHAHALVWSPSPRTGCSRHPKPHHRVALAAANVSFVEIETDRGHDAFLLDEPELFATVRGFLSAAARRRGVA